MSIASSTAVGSGTIPLLDVDHMLMRMPAAIRARLEWTRRPIADSLLRLRKDPLTDELWKEVGSSIWKPLSSIMVAFWETVAKGREEWRPTVMAEIGREQERLSTFLDDAQATHEIEWIWGFIRSLCDWTLALPDQELPSDDALVGAAEDPEFLEFIRPQLAIMGAIDAAKASEDRDRARNLVDDAFLGFVRLRNLFRERGVWLSAFPHETPECLAQRRLLYADRLRSVLATEDWTHLDPSRMRNLR